MPQERAERQPKPHLLPLDPSIVDAVKARFNVSPPILNRTFSEVVQHLGRTNRVMLMEGIGPAFEEPEDPFQSLLRTVGLIGATFTYVVIRRNAEVKGVRIPRITSGDIAAHDEHVDVINAALDSSTLSPEGGVHLLDRYLGPLRKSEPELVGAVRDAAQEFHDEFISVPVGIVSIVDALKTSAENGAAQVYYPVVSAQRRLVANSN